MKRIIIAILGVLMAAQASAGPIEATPTRTKLSSTNVTVSAYTEVIAATTKTLKGISVLNTCASTPLQLALGAAGSETVQLTLPASMSAPVYIPMAAPYGSRISIIALDTTASTGEVQLNAIY